MHIFHTSLASFVRSFELYKCSTVNLFMIVHRYICYFRSPPRETVRFSEKCGHSWITIWTCFVRIRLRIENESRALLTCKKQLNTIIQ